MDVQDSQQLVQVVIPIKGHIPQVQAMLSVILKVQYLAIMRVLLEIQIINGKYPKC